VSSIVAYEGTVRNKIPDAVVLWRPLLITTFEVGRLGINGVLPIRQQRLQELVVQLFERKTFLIYGRDGLRAVPFFFPVLKNISGTARRPSHP
jgi:hypothetical protein